MSALLNSVECVGLTLQGVECTELFLNSTLIFSSDKEFTISTAVQPGAGHFDVFYDGVELSVTQVSTSQCIATLPSSYVPGQLVVKWDRNAYNSTSYTYQTLSGGISYNVLSTGSSTSKAKLDGISGPTNHPGGGWVTYNRYIYMAYDKYNNGGYNGGVSRSDLGGNWSTNLFSLNNGLMGTITTSVQYRLTNTTTINPGPATVSTTSVVAT